MPTGELSLQSFTSIFEIFAGYYLLLGTSKAFHDYFNIVSLYKNWQKVNAGLSDKLRKLDNELKKIVITGQGDTYSEKMARLNKDMQTLKNANRNRVKAEWLIAMDKKWVRQLKQHYHEEEHLESDFYRFMKPFYIFFGSVSFIVLLIGGFTSHWDKVKNLNVLNLVSLFALTVLISAVIRNKIQAKRLPILQPQYSFIISLLLLPILLFIPSDLVVTCQFIPYDWKPGRISYNNLQILVAVFVMFVPIIVHLSCVLILMVQHNIMKWRFDHLPLPNVIESATSPPTIPSLGIDD